MQTVKIMHLLPSDRLSGAENVILQIMDLFKNDSKYEMFYVSSLGPIKEILDQRGVKYHLLPSFSYGEIKKAIKKIKPDIIHAHDIRAGVMAALFSKNIKVISHLHANYPWMKQITVKTLIYTLATFKFKHILGVSNSIYDEYIFHRLIKDKFVELPNVLDEKTINRKAESFAVTPIDLLFVGRLCEFKNPILFLQITEGLIKKGFNINAVMLGDGELKQSCQRYITRHNLEKYVSLKGFVDNPYPYMKAAKILLMPSLVEGFGLVAVEAMLLDTVVVGNPVGGLKNILNTCGLKAGTHKEFIDIITKLLKDPSLLKQQIQKAKSTINIYTNLDKYKQFLNDIYEK